MRLLFIALLCALSYAQTVAHTIPPEGGYCSKVVNDFKGQCTDTDNSFTLYDADGLCNPDFGWCLGMNRGTVFAKNICLLAIYGSGGFGAEISDIDRTLSKYGDLVSAEYVIGGRPRFPMVGNIETESFLPLIHEHEYDMLEEERPFFEKGSTEIATWTNLTCTFKARNYDLTNIVWNHCGDVQDSCRGDDSCTCTCLGGYTRMERSDSQYYYPLNIPEGYTEDSVSVTCQESAFGVSDGMGKSCQCGYSSECQDVSQILPYNCEGAKSESEDYAQSDQWNFKLDCPREVDGLDFFILTAAERDGQHVFVRPDVHIDDELIKTWGPTFREKLNVPINAGEHDLYFKSDDEFVMRYIKLFDSKCTISFDVGSNSFFDQVYEQAMEHANNFLEKLKDGDVTSIGIVAAAVLVPLFCCCLCCCLQRRNNGGKVIYALR